MDAAIIDTDKLNAARNLEQRILRNFESLHGTFVETRAMLREFQATEAYRTLGYSRLQDWVRSKVTSDSSLATKLIRAAEVEAEIEDSVVHDEPLPHAWLVQLSAVPPGERTKTWRAVNQMAQLENVDVTERLIKHVVHRRTLGERLKDGRGEPVENPNLEPAFEARIMFNEAIKRVAAVKRNLMELVGHPGGELINTPVLTVVFSQLAKEIKAMMPYAECPNPKCIGGCEACDGIGWVTRKKWDELEGKK